MSGTLRRLTTAEEIRWLYTARETGGLCGICGREFSADEPVYIERVAVDTRRRLGLRVHSATIQVMAPVGNECASPDFLSETMGRDPEWCAGCDRPLYYRTARSNRHRALCSSYCTGQANFAQRAASKRARSAR